MHLIFLTDHCNVINNRLLDFEWLRILSPSGNGTFKDTFHLVQDPYGKQGPSLYNILHKGKAGIIIIATIHYATVFLLHILFKLTVSNMITKFTRLVRAECKLDLIKFNNQRLSCIGYHKNMLQPSIFYI